MNHSFKNFFYKSGQKKNNFPFTWQVTSGSLTKIMSLHCQFAFFIVHRTQQECTGLGKEPSWCPRPALGCPGWKQGEIFALSSLTSLQSVLIWYHVRQPRASGMSSLSIPSSIFPVVSEEEIYVFIYASF